MKATVTSRGRVTIPAKSRRRLQIRTGTVLDFDEDADHLKAVKAGDPERMRSVVGLGRRETSAKTSSEWLDELRGPVEVPPRRRTR